MTSALGYRQRECMTSRRNLIIVMGVSGCGKSSVARSLSDFFGYDYMEADEFHSEENVKHMASGKPLTDAMRVPWLNSMIDHLVTVSDRHQILAYSGLKKAHRALFRDLPYNIVFLHLHADLKTIADRMALRTGHFMPTALLQSQFEALESTEQEDDVVSLLVDDELETIIDLATVKLSSHLK